MRVNFKPEVADPVGVDAVASFELCAGREGDDSYVKVENDGSEAFYLLYDVLNTGLSAIDLGNGESFEDEETSSAIMRGAALVDDEVSAGEKCSACQDVASLRVGGTPVCEQHVVSTLRGWFGI